MATHNYNSVGLRNVGSYQVSGDPFISGSGPTSQADAKMKRYEFPGVVREFTVANLAKLGDGSTASKAINLSFVSGSAGFDFTSTDTVAVTDATWQSSELQVGQHYWTIEVGSSVTFRTKCKEIYITTMSGAAQYKILGELTNIPVSSMYHLTGSGLTSIDGT
mgnify:CR=1 FL=1